MVKRRFKLVKHNTKYQLMCGKRYADTSKWLEEGKIYGVDDVIVHDWHTEIVIEGRRFNSVCFEEL